MATRFCNHEAGIRGFKKGFIFKKPGRMRQHLIDNYSIDPNSCEAPVCLVGHIFYAFYANRCKGGKTIKAIQDQFGLSVSHADLSRVRRKYASHMQRYTNFEYDRIAFHEACRQQFHLVTPKQNVLNQQWKKERASNLAKLEMVHQFLRDSYSVDSNGSETPVLVGHVLNAFFSNQCSFPKAIQAIRDKFGVQMGRQDVLRLTRKHRICMRQYADSEENRNAFEKGCRQEFQTSVKETEPKPYVKFSKLQERFFGNSEGIASAESGQVSSQNCEESSQQPGPSSSDSVPSASNSVPSTSDSVPSASNSVPSTSDSVPSTSNSVPSTSNSVPSTSSSSQLSSDASSACQLSGDTGACSEREAFLEQRVTLMSQTISKLRLTNLSQLSEIRNKLKATKRLQLQVQQKDGVIQGLRQKLKDTQRQSCDAIKELERKRLALTDQITNLRAESNVQLTVIRPGKEREINQLRQQKQEEINLLRRQKDWEISCVRRQKDEEIWLLHRQIEELQKKCASASEKDCSSKIQNDQKSDGVNSVGIKDCSSKIQNDQKSDGVNSVGIKKETSSEQQNGQKSCGANSVDVKKGEENIIMDCSQSKKAEPAAVKRESLSCWMVW